ncbi:MAG: hypothetical protein QOF41_2111 [Methylobacteriaceae bacterium]|nr:hypothetical protein [Methylobacteriaceae bacterium]
MPFSWYLRVVAALVPVFLAGGLGLYMGIAFGPESHFGVAGIVERKEASWRGCRVWIDTEFGSATANFAHNCAKIAWNDGQHVTVDIRPSGGRSWRSWSVNDGAADLTDGDPVIAD